MFDDDVARFAKSMKFLERVYRLMKELHHVGFGVTTELIRKVTVVLISAKRSESEYLDIGMNNITRLCDCMKVARMWMTLHFAEATWSAWNLKRVSGYPCNAIDQIFARHKLHCSFVKITKSCMPKFK